MSSIEPHQLIVDKINSAERHLGERMNRTDHRMHNIEESIRLMKESQEQDRLKQQTILDAEERRTNFQAWVGRGMVATVLGLLANEMANLFR